MTNKVNATKILTCFERKKNDKQQANRLTIPSTSVRYVPNHQLLRQELITLWSQRETLALRLSFPFYFNEIFFIMLFHHLVRVNCQSYPFKAVCSKLRNGKGAFVYRVLPYVIFLTE